MCSNRIRLALQPAVLFCILISTGVVSTIGSPSKVQELDDATAYYERGLELYKSGIYEGAINFFKKAVKLRKDYADAHYHLGDAYFQLKQYKQAIEAYKKAVRYQSNFHAYNHMGTAYYRLRDHKNAIEAYKEAIRLDSKAASTYYNLAASYLERDTEKAALEQYKILKGLDPQLAHKLYLLIYKPMAAVFAPTGVRLNIIATDAQGNPVNDLTQDDFQVFEDGIPQRIIFFSSEQFPLVYSIAVDASGSMRGALQQAVELGKAIIQNNRPNDETSLIRFISSDKIETVEDFTSDLKKLNNGLNSFYVETGQSAILDAVYLSAQQVAQYKPDNSLYRRRAIIVITDGEDRASYYSIDDLANLLRKIDVQIFAVCLKKDSDKRDQLNKNLANGAEALLTRLADETGGLAFFPKSVSELNTVIDQLTTRARRQYVIGYKPAKAVEAPTFRRLNVQILDKAGREKLSAVTRTGYAVSAAKPEPE